MSNTEYTNINSRLKKCHQGLHSHMGEYWWGDFLILCELSLQVVLQQWKKWNSEKEVAAKVCSRRVCWRLQILELMKNNAGSTSAAAARGSFHQWPKRSECDSTGPPFISPSTSSDPQDECGLSPLCRL